MKKTILCILLLVVLTECFGQLVRRKDYDAAFALQAGGETGMLTTFRHPKLSLSPAFGLKMTFPFNRKWFLGSEVNYSRLKYEVSDQVEAHWDIAGETGNFDGAQLTRFDLKQIQVPVYLKYMLSCNKASVLFGFYGSYVFDAGLTTSLEGGGYRVAADLSEVADQWNAGITIGYEHRIVKHLEVTCRISAGVKEVVKQSLWGDRLFPLQACLTVSYDIFRIGDCGCD